MIPGVAGWMKGVGKCARKALPIMDLLLFVNKRSQLSELKRRILVVDHGDVFEVALLWMRSRACSISRRRIM